MNAVYDSTEVFGSLSDEAFCGIYAVCHVLGMSSACANPVIYGFLNENFSKEFRVRRQCHCSCLIWEVIIKLMASKFPPP